MSELFANNTAAPIDLFDLVLNLVIAAGLALALGLHYRFLGATLSGRAHYGRIFVFVAATTALIISIVKSSLALSLGLVGALSIVRFRTPVKEPEELAYLFMAIAIGLGMGADYRAATSVSTLVILILVGLVQWRFRLVESRNLYLNIGVDIDQGEGGDQPLVPINGILARHCGQVDLRRMDSGDGRLELTYFVDLRNDDALASLSADLEASFAGVRLTMVDQTRLPSL